MLLDYGATVGAGETLSDAGRRDGNLAGAAIVMRSYAKRTRDRVKFHHHAATNPKGDVIEGYRLAVNGCASVAYGNA